MTHYSIYSTLLLPDLASSDSKELNDDCSALTKFVFTAATADLHASCGIDISKNNMHIRKY